MSKYFPVMKILEARSKAGGNPDNAAIAQITKFGFRPENANTPLNKVALPGQGNRYVFEADIPGGTTVGTFKLYNSHQESPWAEILQGRITSSNTGEVSTFNCVGGELSKISFLTPEAFQVKSLAEISLASFSKEAVITVGDDGGQFFGEEKVVDVPIGEIIRFEFQPRFIFNQARINSLAESLMEHGQNRPIILRKLTEDERKKIGMQFKYEISGGERRFRATKVNGTPTVKAIIKNISDSLLVRIAKAALDNTNHEPLSMYENILLVHRLFEPTGGDIGEIRRITQLSVGLITGYLGLRKLSPAVLEKLSPELPEEYRLRLADAHTIARVKDAEAQLKVYSETYQHLGERGIGAVRRALNDKVDTLAPTRKRSRNQNKEAAGRTVMAIIDTIHTLNPDLLPGFRAYLQGLSASNRGEVLGSLNKVSKLLPGLIMIADEAVNRALQ